MKLGYIAAVAALAVLAQGVAPARAHCDTLDGPVVKEAQAALAKGEITPVLKWIKAEHEKELRAAFEKTLKVRSGGTDAQELADRYFLETLVRLHRAGEGAPYEGLKAAGTDLGPAIVSADRALESGSDEALVKLLSDALIDGVRRRHHEAVEARKHAADSVEAGRTYVTAYVEFVHFVERLDQAIKRSAHEAERHDEAAIAPKAKAPSHQH